jgi:hypothetical protein
MKPEFEKAYLNELLIQSEYARTSVGRMNEMLTEGNPAPFFREAQGFLSHAAAISRILWPPQVKGRAKNTRAKDRGEHLRAVLGVSDNHPLRTRTLRDHLEHFDERLDQWSQETTHGVIIDLCIGPALPAFFQGAAVDRGDFLRVYEPDRQVFTFRGDEFNIQELVTGVNGIHAATVERMRRLDATQP